MHRFLLHNGEIRRTTDLLVSPGQTGYMNGWGVFSTLRVYEGALFAFDRHYARMKHDAALLRVAFPFSAGELESALLKLVEANQVVHGTLRVAVVRNRGGIFEEPAISSETDLVAFTANLADWGQGVKLAYVPDARHAASPFAGTKVTSWCQNLTWNEEAHERGFDEVILLNEYGRVSECTSANIFAVLGKQVCTPPLSEGCLPGVTRAILLEEIRVPDLLIEERNLTRADLETADQVFITSTTRNLLPVLEIEGHPVRQANAVFHQLHSAFSRYQAASWRSPVAESEPARL
jgi:branched-chain amino acid aminotransferase